jgi:hypothetical protein
MIDTSANPSATTSRRARLPVLALALAAALVVALLARPDRWGGEAMATGVGDDLRGTATAQKTRTIGAATLSALPTGTLPDERCDAEVAAPETADDAGDAAERGPLESSSTTLRIVLEAPSDAPEVPRPELLAIGPLGNVVRADATRTETPVHTERSSATTRTTTEFRIDEPGTYIAAWYVWVDVPGTRVRRACRGQSEPLRLTSLDRPAEIALRIRPGDLIPDPALDANQANPIWHETPRDG